MDPDGRMANQAKTKKSSGEATPEEHKLADNLKTLSADVIQTINKCKEKLKSMPKAEAGLNPLWGLMAQPLFQILAAVGLLLSGVLGLVRQLLGGLGLGGILDGLLGGLGLDKILGGLGLGDVLGGGGKKGKKGGGGGGLLGGVTGGGGGGGGGLLGGVTGGLLG